jgi:YHS domain-containing protein
MKEKSKLPPGWTEMVSRSTGRTYYWNAELQRSQFDKPTGSEEPGLAKATSPPSSPGGEKGDKKPASEEDASLPQGWVSMVSRSTGRVYYFNVETQQSQFDRPT